MTDNTASSFKISWQAGGDGHVPIQHNEVML